MDNFDDLLSGLLQDVVNTEANAETLTDIVDNTKLQSFAPKKALTSSENSDILTLTTSVSKKPKNLYKYGRNLQTELYENGYEVSTAKEVSLKRFFIYSSVCLERVLKSNLKIEADNFRTNGIALAPSLRCSLKISTTKFKRRISAITGISETGTRGYVQSSFDCGKLTDTHLLDIKFFADYNGDIFLIIPELPETMSMINSEAVDEIDVADNKNDIDSKCCFVDTNKIYKLFSSEIENSPIHKIAILPFRSLNTVKANTAEFLVVTLSYAGKIRYSKFNILYSDARNSLAIIKPDELMRNYAMGTIAMDFAVHPGQLHIALGLGNAQINIISIYDLDKVSALCTLKFSKQDLSGNSKEEENTQQLNLPPIKTLAFDQTGKFLLCAMDDGVITIWDLRYKRLVEFIDNILPLTKTHQVLTDGFVNGVTTVKFFEDDITRIAVGGECGSLQILDLGKRMDYAKAEQLNMELISIKEKGENLSLDDISRLSGSLNPLIPQDRKISVHGKVKNILAGSISDKIKFIETIKIPMKGGKSTYLMVIVSTNKITIHKYWPFLNATEFIGQLLINRISGISLNVIAGKPNFITLAVTSFEKNIYVYELELIEGIALENKEMGKPDTMEDEEIEERAINPSETNKIKATESLEELLDF